MKNLQNNKAQVYLDNILNNIPGSIYWKDIDGMYLGCNKMQAEMAGLNYPEDIIGKTDYQLPWKNIADDLKKIDQRIMQTDCSEELIENPILANGKQIIMLTNKSPLYDSKGKVIGIIGTSLDITARTQAEEREKEALVKAFASETERKSEEEAKKAVMILAGSIVHDLRSPLLILAMNNQRLKKDLSFLIQHYNDTKKLSDIKKLNEKDVENILNIPKNIEGSITKMNLFIDDNLKTLKNSILKSLKEEDLVECKSYKGISDVLDTYPFQEGEKELIQWDRSYYFNFLGNQVLFLRVLFNLLNNSLYQIQKNSKGKIFISSKKKLDSNIIYFKDTAGGASPDIVKHIFDGYITTKKDGTGVGLSFCKLTMESFGGSITCNSVEGDFIEFILTFPQNSTSQPLKDEVQRITILQNN